MHAVVLLVAMVVSGFATSSHTLAPSLALRLGAINAEGLVGTEGGSVGSVSLARSSMILKPVALPTAAPRSRAVVFYTVSDADSVKALAARFGVKESSIRWSNYDALKQVDQDVTHGQQVMIPPVDGVAVKVAEGDTAGTLAARFHVEAQAVIDFNYLRDPDHLTPGDILVIPGGSGEAFVQPPPPVRVISAPPRAAASTASSSSSYTVSSGGVPAGGASGNRFTYGYCTWYVASRRPVPWLGDAWQWYGQAQAYGWATGKTPRPGAIMVTWESGWGHVALVESVAADGSWKVSEMNFVGWGVVSQRTIRPGTVPLIGFIY